jgi:hypothetical protein
VSYDPARGARGQTNPVRGARRQLTATPREMVLSVGAVDVIAKEQGIAVVKEKSGPPFAKNKTAKGRPPQRFPPSLGSATRQANCQRAFVLILRRLPLLLGVVWRFAAPNPTNAVASCG